MDNDNLNDEVKGSEKPDSALCGGLGRAERIMERIFSPTRHGAVFGEPVKSGEYTLITASEVSGGGGFGLGEGWSGQPGSDGNAGAQNTTGTAGGAGPSGGSGGGGGGGALGRPVAVIVIGPQGVKVEPIVDVTKIALQALKMWGRVTAILSSVAKQRGKKG